MDTKAPKSATTAAAPTNPAEPVEVRRDNPAKARPVPQGAEVVEVRRDSPAKPRPVCAVAELAADQDGVVEHDQLLALGFSHAWIKDHLRIGYLHIVFRGVYAVGHKRITWRGRLRAAALACGPDAWLSHWTAADFCSMWHSDSPVIHVTAPPGGREDRDGIVVHRVRNMRDVEKTVIDGLPVTSPARTCLDMAARLKHPRAIAAMLDNAERGGFLTYQDFLAVCKRGRPGSQALRAALAIYAPLPGGTRSSLERRGLRELARAGVHPDGVNVWIPEAAAEADLVFHDPPTVVEIDGEAIHGTTAARLRDPQRDHRFRRAGYAVLRVPERRLVHEPWAFVADVKDLLSRAAGTRARPGR